MNVVFHSCLESAARGGRGFRTGRAPAFARRAGSERGVALIITLILLAVITFMAIAMLVLSRGQKSSVTTTTDLTVARGAADAALARAEAQMLAPILAWTNPAAVGMLVSTNYVNPAGFTAGSGPAYTSPANVSYTYANGNPLAGSDSLQNLANLLYDPRPPVFITNQFRGGYDFRYYLDLNRNGAFEPTGWVIVTNQLGQPVRSGNGFALTYQVGDPQWIGGLEFADRPHSARNPFAYRYAYMVIPASQTLDVNYIHNQANNPAKAAFDPGGRDFLRNQGVGTWEINLGAFLYDLNTNTYAWGGAYDYTPPIAGQSTPLYISRGNAFFDAFEILSNRYGGALSSQSPIAGAFGLYANNGASAFALDGMDGYSAGPVMTTSWRPARDPDINPLNRTLRPWPGADNTNHFFTSQDLFTRFRATDDFPTRLQAVGLRTNTYDRYTFYRLLSQLGTDSSPEPANKINLNYDNLVRTNNLGVSSSTNFAPWRPLDFFTNAANALLANAGYKFTITNIQVYPTNYYTASVHRMLQLALNIYDSTTNRTFAAAIGRPDPYCPTVLRPLFRRVPLGNTNVVMIVGYREVFGTALASSVTGPRIVELDNGNIGANLLQIPPISTGPQANERLEPLISGMPLVIGAKKGLPNFNEFSMQTFVYLSRLMEFRRATINGPVTETNLMYVLTVTNTFGLEAWNSYSNAYPRNLQLVAAVDMTPTVSSLLGSNLVPLLNTRVTRGISVPIPAGTWRGWNTLGDAQYSFMLPWTLTNNVLFTNATYSVALNRLIPETHIFRDPPNQFYAPHWILNVNARIRYILIDTDQQRIVDYVNLNNWDPTVDLTGTLAAGADCTGNPASLSNPSSQWCTNRQSNLATAPTLGMINQISAGLGMGNVDLKSFSLDPFSGRDAESAVDGFRYNLMGWGPQYDKDQGKTFYRSNVFYAPLTPYTPLYVHTSLQANDPLVHYTLGDLSFLGVNITNVDFQSQNPALPNLGQINDRYEPWGGNPYKSTGIVPAYQIAVKDPNVRRSDDWDFPTNKYPNVGWLGKVHRGTPWQTIYLKSSNIVLQAGSPVLQNLAAWGRWTGNYTNGAVWGYVSNNIIPLYPTSSFLGVSNVFPDSVYTLPTNDWRILDLFTSAFDQNSTRGQLSVNQTNLAAWSAVLAGVNILSNTTQSGFIEPAGAYALPPAPQPPLVQIVNGIINARTNFPNNTYQRMGDILAAPELTISSPYLLGGTNIVNDAAVERIPQQIMGLLRGGEQPRFVIYSYGQTLRPAEHSIVPSGTYFGLCTNYQITAEVATRAVVRIDGAPQKPHAVVESFNVLPPD